MSFPTGYLQGSKRTDSRKEASGFSALFIYHSYAYVKQLQKNHSDLNIFKKSGFPKSNIFHTTNTVRENGEICVKFFLINIQKIVSNQTVVGTNFLTCLILSFFFIKKNMLIGVYIKFVVSQQITYISKKNSKFMSNNIYLTSVPSKYMREVI